jgi:hypothetical protein
MTIRRMHIACWIPKATNSHSGYIIHIAFPLQQRLNERASMLRYTYTTCLGIFNLMMVHEDRNKYTCICFVHNKRIFVFDSILILLINMLVCWSGDPSNNFPLTRNFPQQRCLETSSGT